MSPFKPPILLTPLPFQKVYQLYQGWIRSAKQVDEAGLVFDHVVLDVARTYKTVKFGKKIPFRATVAVGDGAYVFGLGKGKDANKRVAVDKAIAQAKKTAIVLQLGCGSLDCIHNCTAPHSLLFKTEGRCCTSRVTILPGPVGTGVIAGGNLKKMLLLTAIKDVWVTLKGSPTPMNSGTALATALINYHAMLQKRPIQGHLE